MGAIFWTSEHGVYALEQSYIVQPTVAEALPSEEPKSEPKVIDGSEIKATLDAWAHKYSGKASVTILDTQTGQLLASSNADKQFFTASIYKLFVAYLGSQDIDSGAHKGSESFIGGYTRQECIVRMIQFSDSPCAETLLNEMGKGQANDRLGSLGLSGTSLVGFHTTSQDAALVTRLVAIGQGLSATSAKYLQDAMNAQMYRDALPKGFAHAKVADKVGFYETGYHDSANVTPRNNHTFTVSVLSENMGSRQIAELARSLEPILEKL